QLTCRDKPKTAQIQIALYLQTLQGEINKIQTNI
ncbi:MAG: hypothetical protein RL020_1327, partial [Pseudomonadota bacterium]